jgi:hypothetical protein
MEQRAECELFGIRYRDWLESAADDCQQNTGRNCRTNDAGHIGPHGMH